MKLAQCRNGHYYNQEITQFCPVCGNGSGAENTNNILVRNENALGNSSDDTATVYLDQNMETEEMTVPMFDGDLDDMPTMGMPIAEEVWSPVVGWIVCVEGKSRGRDYRIHPERNFIGRTGDMDISVYEDEKIALRYHCSIVYEPIKKEYMLVPGSETSTFYNGELLEEYVKLNENDKIKIGDSTFVFVPFCKGDVSW